MNFSEIKCMLNALKSKAELIDKRNGKNKQPLFSESLFIGPATHIGPCIDETLSIMKTLESTQDAHFSSTPCDKYLSPNLSQEKIQHLSEKLINQISAIQREIATQALRQKEKQTSRMTKNKLAVLQQDLKQHRIWRERLSQRLSNIREQLSQTHFPDNLDALNELASKTEERLTRCKQSQMNIEHQIHLLEKARNL